MLKPIHCEKIKLRINPSPNCIALKKMAIIVSKITVRKRLPRTDFGVIPSNAGFI